MGETAGGYWVLLRFICHKVNANGPKVDPALFITEKPNVVIEVLNYTPHIRVTL